MWSYHPLKYFDDMKSEGNRSEFHCEGLVSPRRDASRCWHTFRAQSGTHYQCLLLNCLSFIAAKSSGAQNVQSDITCWGLTSLIQTRSTILGLLTTKQYYFCSISLIVLLLSWRLPFLSIRGPTVQTVACVISQKRRIPWSWVWFSQRPVSSQLFFGYCEQYRKGIPYFIFYSIRVVAVEFMCDCWQYSSLFIFLFVCRFIFLIIVFCSAECYT